MQCKSWLPFDCDLGLADVFELTAWRRALGDGNDEEFFPDFYEGSKET